MRSDKSMIEKGLKSMKNPPPKKNEEKMDTCCISESHDKYPWGLTIDLNDDSMKNLDLTAKDFSVGDVVTCIVKCEVKSVSSREDSYDDGKKKDSVDLQITDMKIETEDE